MAKDIILLPYNGSLEQARRSIGITQMDISNSTRWLEEARALLKDAHKRYILEKRRTLARHKVRRMVGQKMWDEAFSSLALGTAVPVRREDVARMRYRLHECQQNLIRHNTDLAHQQQALARLESTRAPAVRVNRLSTLRLLNALENIDSVALRDADNRITITMQFKDLTMAPVFEQREVADFIAWTLRTSHEVEIDPHHVPIDDCKITITYHRHNGSIDIAGESTEPFSNERYSSYIGRFHPHWLSYRGPCLGDFGSPIQEAMSALDLVSVATLMRMYLTTYNLNDIAGRYGIFYGAPRQTIRDLTVTHLDYRDWQNRMSTDLRYLNRNTPPGEVEPITPYDLAA